MLAEEDVLPTIISPAPPHDTEDQQEMKDRQPVCTAVSPLMQANINITLLSNETHENCSTLTVISDCVNIEASYNLASKLQLQLLSVKSDVIDAVLKALELAGEVNASQHHFIQILQYGKELYCKGNPGFENLWPQSWQSAIKLLEDQGYKGAIDYFICLSNDHPVQTTS